MDWFAFFLQQRCHGTSWISNQRSDRSIIGTRQCDDYQALCWWAIASCAYFHEKQKTNWNKNVPTFGTAQMSRDDKTMKCDPRNQREIPIFTHQFYQCNSNNWSLTRSQIQTQIQIQIQNIMQLWIEMKVRNQWKIKTLAKFTKNRFRSNCRNLEKDIMHKIYPFMHHSVSFCIILYRFVSFYIILHHPASSCISWDFNDFTNFDSFRFISKFTIQYHVLDRSSWRWLYRLKIQSKWNLCPFHLT
jgi:hypothetical protein